MPETIELTEEMEALLRAGAANTIGICCLPGQVQKNWAALREAERQKLIFFQDVERPIITDMGRRAIGEPAQIDADYARLVAACGGRRRLEPRRDQDPRTDFDYRSYKACGYVCTLVVRQPDDRPGANTIRVGKTLDSEKQFLGPNNSIVLPECEGTPFVLALMPDWLVRRTGFSTYPLALDETDTRWSAEDRETWDRLRRVCQSVNVRIRNAGRRAQGNKLRYGEYA